MVMVVIKKIQIQADGKVAVFVVHQSMKPSFLGALIGSRYLPIIPKFLVKKFITNKLGTRFGFTESDIVVIDGRSLPSCYHGEIHFSNLRDNLWDNGRLMYLI